MAAKRNGPNRRAYVLSGFGIIDLLAILPTYLTILVPQAAPLLMVRLVRILRIFRVLRLLAYIQESNILIRAVKRSGHDANAHYCKFCGTTLPEPVA